MLIPLTNSVLFAEIDDADYYSTFTVYHKSGASIKVRPCDINWYIEKDGYACANKRVNYIQYSCYLHRMILGRKPGLVIDHISQNKLDNKRSNLQFVTQSQNAFNRKSSKGTSVYKGVCWDNKRNKYLAQIMAQGRNKYLGCFINEVDAAIAYDTALRGAYPNAPAAAFNF